jgi:hypothetical protein
VQVNTRSRRKFATEFIYLVVVHIDWVSRPQELPELQKIEFERPPHIYIIASLPRVTIKPETITGDEEFIEGTVCIQNGAEVTEHHFRSRHDFGTGWTLDSQWPHDEYSVVDSNGDVIASGVVANLGTQASHEWPIETRFFDVLYVGQAYGTDGDRIAPDRLAAHATLQKILAECPRDKQIWLMVASISDEQLLIEIAGRVTPSTTDEEDAEHQNRIIRTIDNPAFHESEAVSMAEAGLIRYFQPPYNEIFKTAFPGPRHKMLESLRELDLLGLLVELQAFDMPLSLGSDKVPSSPYHEAKFYIHLDGPDRVSDWAMRDWLE